MHSGAGGKMITPMVRSVAIVSLLLIFVVDGFCADPEEKSATDAQNLVMGVWRVPPGFISTPDLSDKNGTRKPLPGFQSKQNPNAVQFDASDFLRGCGFSFPPGSDAIYDQNSSSLIVRNTQENLDLVDALIGGCGGEFPSNVVVDISTYEVQLPAQNVGPFATWPTAFVLQELPNLDKKLLDRISVLTKSGRRASIKHLIAPDTASASPPPELRDETESTDLFQDDESGTIVDCEPIVGPNNVVIDANVTYRFRSPASSKESSEICFNTEFTTWEGYPVVLHVSPSPTHEGKFLVVVANIRVVNAGGWNFKEAAGGPSPAASPEG